MGIDVGRVQVWVTQIETDNFWRFYCTVWCELIFFKGNVESWAKCFICEHLIEDISILPCNHYFCKDCIISWINEEEKCPECSEEANTEKIKGATLFINRAFSGFKIKCSLDNCDEFIEYESIKSHETECLEKMIPCEHCEEKIKRVELEEHMVRHFFSS